MIDLLLITWHNKWLILSVSIIAGGLLTWLIDWLTWKFGTPYIGQIWRP
jgi:hypothetical protein